MKRYCVLVFLILSSISPAQFKIGVSGDFLLSSSDMNWQFGPGFLFQYSPDNLPISIRFNSHFYLAETVPVKISPGLSTLTDFGIGISIIGNPLPWVIKPYLGAGIYYSDNNTSQVGMPGYSEGNYTFFNKIDNSFSYRIIGGLEFSDSPTSFFMEVNYIINQPEYELMIDQSPGVDILKKYKFNFNSVFLKLGLMFSL